ncbi:MAG: RtcB family protein [Chloroflexi bacterium]|nr:RtcB family protein [Chloroflexota bacterium]
MVRRQDFGRIDEFIWEAPRTTRDDMRVPAWLFGDSSIVEAAIADRAAEQLLNVTTLPGIVGRAIAMPDVHQGYGFPIGGVAATDPARGGVISPGGVGYDINCGVRLLRTEMTAEELMPYLDDLTHALYLACPSGLGGSGRRHVSPGELDDVLTEGARWARRAGLAADEDLENTEEGGRMPGADPSAVSARARSRGADQVGSLGSGNHFLETDVVDAVYDSAAAGCLGLWEGQVVVQIHCGSRGFGHQVCDDYVQELQSVVRRYGIELPDRELVCAPFDSREGQAYFGAMACAVNYAFANRQVLAMGVREAFERVLAGKVSDHNLTQVYDVAHNIAKIEEHTVGGQRLRLCVHRKGATRSFGPGHPALPRAYQKLGQPVLVPGSMGTASYVLVGTQRAMELAFGSTCHGAGRRMSRRQAMKAVRGQQLRRDLASEGIIVRAGSNRSLAEEAPIAYKDIDLVVRIVDQAGIARKVVRLRPLSVIKG